MLPQGHEEWQTHNFTRQASALDQRHIDDGNFMNVDSHVAQSHPPSEPYSTTRMPSMYQSRVIDDSFTYTSDPYGTAQASTWSSAFFEYADSPPADYPEDTHQLQQWAYETCNPNLTVAERFEKSKWEKERREKL